MYVVKVHDSNEPICVSHVEARIWAKLTFRYWLEKVKLEGFAANDNSVMDPYILDASQIDNNVMPDIICKKSLYSLHYIYFYYFSLLLY